MDLKKILEEAKLKIENVKTTEELAAIALLDLKSV